MQLRDVIGVPEFVSLAFAWWIMSHTDLTIFAVVAIGIVLMAGIRMIERAMLSGRSEAAWCVIVLITAVLLSVAVVVSPTR